MVGSEVDLKSSTTINMSQLIKLREYELLEMQEFRNKELETIIVNKDKQLMEYLNVVEILKNDFQFNLKLLEARDNEILKYENELKLKVNEVELIEKDKSLLIQRIEELTNKEIKRIHSIEQDKLFSKSKLKELKQEIETMYWTFGEEKRSLLLQIGQLTDDVKTMKAQYEESMDRQRTDLTETYEQLLKNKYLQHNDKEASTNQSIALLEARINQLKNEHSKLVIDSQSLHTINTNLEKSLAARADQLKSLNNEKLELLATITSLERSNKILMETSKVEYENLRADYSTIVQLSEQLKLELKTAHEESETRKVQRTEDLKEIAYLQQQLNETTDQLQRSRLSSDDLQTQLTAARSELARCEDKARLIDDSNVEYMRRIRFLEVDAENLKQRLTDAATNDSKATAAEAEAVAVQHIASLEQQLNMMIVEKDKFETRYQELVSEFDAYKMQRNVATVSASSADGIVSNLKLQLAIESSNNEILTLELVKKNENIIQLQTLLKEYMHGDVSKISSEKHRTLQRQPVSAAPSSSQVNTPAPKALHLLTQNQTQSHHHGALESPAFSEDLGPVSVPASPALSLSSPHWRRKSMENTNRKSFFAPNSVSERDEWRPVSHSDSSVAGRDNDFDRYDSSDDEQRVGDSRKHEHAMKDNTQSHDHHRLVSFGPSHVRSDASDEQSQQQHLMERNRQLVETNDNLKAVIRDMRHEMESLSVTIAQHQHESETPSKELEQSKKQAASQLEEIASLKQRVEQTTAEVVRLRAERRRLMELSNELRAALMKYTPQQTSSSGQPSLTTGAASSGSSSSMAHAVLPPPPPPQQYQHQSQYTSTPSLPPTYSRPPLLPPPPQKIMSATEQIELNRQQRNDDAILRHPEMNLTSSLTVTATADADKSYTNEEESATLAHVSLQTQSLKSASKDYVHNSSVRSPPRPPGPKSMVRLTKTPVKAAAVAESSATRSPVRGFASPRRKVMNYAIKDAE